MEVLNLLILVGILVNVKSENILVIVSTPFKSHASMVYNLITELAKTHQVTFAVPRGFEMNNPPENVTLILPDTYDDSFESNNIEF
jgi:hypothetical protein